MTWYEVIFSDDVCEQLPKTNTEISSKAQKEEIYETLVSTKGACNMYQYYK